MVVTPTDGDQVEIVATKSSVTSDPESVSFRVVEGEFGLLICTIYPEAPGEIPPKCDTEAVTITQGENDVNVRYEIRIPSGLLADINTIAGNIQALGLDVPFKGKAVNGNVTVSTSNFAIAETVNGDVDVSMGNPSHFLTIDEGIELKTVTGQLTVTVPPDNSFDYEMSAVSRQIDSAFPRKEGIGMSARVAREMADRFSGYRSSMVR